MSMGYLMDFFLSNGMYNTSCTGNGEETFQYHSYIWFDTFLDVNGLLNGCFLSNGMYFILSYI